MDLTVFRSTPAEQARTADLLALAPTRGRRALDIGSRDGFMAKLLADRFDEVVALDLTQPEVEHPRVRPVAGDASQLTFADDSFDFVLCAEVLEHIPQPALQKVAHEITRVAGSAMVIGVPYRQDLRVGRTTCAGCGGHNPPFGHINTFSESDLAKLFPNAQIDKTSFVGMTRSRTNWISSRLLDYAGNPYGSYNQIETCIHCDGPIGRPARRTLTQRLATRVAVKLTQLQQAFAAPRPKWVHIRFTKQGHSSA